MQERFSGLIRRALMALGVVAILGGLVGAGQGMVAEGESDSEVAAALPWEEARVFAEILERVKQEYVEPVDDRELMNKAIRGMLSGLDPHSAYLDKDEFEDIQENTSGSFGGLGLEVTSEDGFVTVISPIDETPAARAGLQPGDMIVRVGDRSLKGMSLEEAVELMRGEPGSEVRLTVMREGEDQPLKFTIEREVIQVTSTSHRLLEPGYGYVRITQFRDKVGDDLAEAVDRLKEENGGSLRGIVLDLRNNPGGVLAGAVEVSDAFLDEGVIVTAEGRTEKTAIEESASAGDLLDGAPLVVLVNAGTASASEIVAGALQDHGRALIMGRKTFGKGSVQTIMPLPDGGALKLTTARYYTPDGRSIQAEGIQPDVTVGPVEVSRTTERNRPLVEADLQGHLRNGEGGPDTGGDDAASELLEEDYPLYEALNMLKGLNILDRRGG